MVFNLLSKGKEGSQTQWVDATCADCPGFLVPAAAGAPTSG